MTTAIMKYEALSEVLVPLTEEFEAGNRHGVRIDGSRMAQSEALRECIAELLAEGWLEQCDLSNCYKLTGAGYQQFGARMRALRTLAACSVA
ncbi:MAG TPA: hypothetical protein VMD78_16505 [Candidatus Baltobacteraceae bacterium]|nr:hypothetical protein [Candidatus Baltobacteraceae bacterium]